MPHITHSAPFSRANNTHPGPRAGRALPYWATIPDAFASTSGNHSAAESSNTDNAPTDGIVHDTAAHSASTAFKFGMPANVGMSHRFFHIAFFARSSGAYTAHHFYIILLLASSSFLFFLIKRGSKSKQNAQPSKPWSRHPITPHNDANADMCDYFNLDAWQHEDRYRFARTVQKSSKRSAEQGEESVWVRRSRGAWGSTMPLPMQVSATFAIAVVRQSNLTPGCNRG